MQSKLERDTADALSDIRSAMTRNVQTLQALQSGAPDPAGWTAEAARLLRAVSYTHLTLPTIYSV